MNYDDKQTLSLVTVSLAVLSCLDLKLNELYKPNDMINTTTLADYF